MDHAVTERSQPLQQAVSQAAKHIFWKLLYGRETGVGGHGVWCDPRVTGNGYHCASLIGKGGGGEINANHGDLHGKTAYLSVRFLAFRNAKQEI